MVTKAKTSVKKNPTTLPGSKDEFEITLPVWAGFAVGPTKKVATGKVRVSIGGDAMGAEEIGPEQQAAYRIVMKSPARNQRMVLDAIASKFADLTRGAEIPLPKAINRAALERLVTLTTIHLHWVHRENVAYVGYQLACAWDTEHDVGVMTHKDRVVEVGHADTAFLAWIAERDRKKRRR